MVPEIGQFSLIVALCMAIIQAVFPMWGSFRQRESWLSLSNYSAYGQLFFVLISFATLVYALLSNDFSVAYVAQNSNTHLPAIYRFCAAWGAHEGSLLLWVLILSAWSALFASSSRKMTTEIRARVLSVLALISIGFFLFILMTSDPFTRILPDAPLQGRDLNPLLQDPGLAIHPPILYLGYVGFSLPFAIAITALISGRFDSEWARLARPWSLLAWSFLTFGIVLGSWWAYRMLGWGGWWFWDPVENASFLPWLSGTALIHSLIVAEKRDAFKAWTILVAVFTFSLSLMGTFLVRSGVLVSVHAFAIDPSRGSFMLYFLAIVVGASFLLYAWRGHTIKNSGIFQLWSRETMLLTNNVLLTCCMLTVLLGTIYPLIIEALGLGKLSVGPPYFNTVFIPLMLPVLFLIGIGPALHWQNSTLLVIVRRFKYTFPVCLLLALILPITITGHVHASVILGLLSAFWIILATLQNNLAQRQLQFSRRAFGMTIAHIGFGVCIIGIVLSSAYSIQREVSMQPADMLSIGPYSVKFEGVNISRGPNYSGYLGNFQIKQNEKVMMLHPELRIYDAQRMALSKTAIRAQPFHDLYIALGESLNRGAWSVRIYYKPFIRWIWAGGILMMIGGFLAARRLKRGTN